MKTYETPEYAIESAYNNGYKKGYEDGKRDAVKKGRWVDDTDFDTIACTECGHMWNTIDNCTETFNYCPNCGADMRGDKT